MAPALTRFVNKVKSYSADGKFHDLLNLMNKSRAMLIQKETLLDTTLEKFSVQQHSLGVLIILCVKMSLPTPTIPNNNETLISQIQDFILGCNAEHVRYATKTFSELIHLYTCKLMSMGTPMRGIHLVNEAILKIRVSVIQLTSIHVDLCQLCLAAKCFKPALEFLDSDVISINDEGLMIGGDFLQKSIAIVLLTTITVLALDKNTGLAKQVVASVLKKNLKGISIAFQTISLSEVARRVHLPSTAEAEKYLLNMIEDGEIFAKINHKDGLVNFHEDPALRNQGSIERMLEQEMNDCMEIGRLIQSLSDEVVVNPQFVMKNNDNENQDIPPNTP